MKKVIKQIVFAGLSFCIAALAAGCGNAETEKAPAAEQEVQETQEGQESQTASEPSEYTFTDALGREISIKDPQKVAVGNGSFADAWMLAGGEVAAVTQDANYREKLGLSDDVIDLGSMLTPNVEVMVAEGIDFAILSAQVSKQVALLDTLEAVGIPVAYFDVETFDDYLQMLKICTDITGHPELYKKNGEDIQVQIDKAIARKEGKPSPKVLLIRAYSTGAKAKGSDGLAGAMLKDMGCQNIADSDTSLLEDLSMEKIIQEDPDYIFVTTMGPSTEAAIQSLAEGIQSNPAWKDLTAVKEGRYIILDKELFHYKPNARWGESYEKLADILYGEE